MTGKSGKTPSDKKSALFVQQWPAPVAVHQNVEQELIIITVDKVLLCLQTHQELLRSQTDWHTPLGTFLTFGTSLIFSDFKSVFGINKDVVFGFFMACFVANAAWLIVAALRAWKCKERAGVKRIIDAMKAQSASGSGQ